jgi:hypothetical protein
VRYFFFIIFAFVAFGIFGTSGLTWAQQGDDAGVQEAESVDGEEGRPDGDGEDQVEFVPVNRAAKLYETLRIQSTLTDLDMTFEELSDMKPTFFTLYQYLLLEEAKQGIMIGHVDLGDEAVEDRPRGIREISLGGIAYNSEDSWTVWLNGKRITPKALPEEVKELKVKKDHIEIRWYDAFSDQIFPIRLRPHQRFNLDGRIFLPGISTASGSAN